MATAVYQSAAATASFGSLLETRERDEKAPRSLTLSTTKLERLLEHDGGRVSPAVSSAKYSELFSTPQSSPIDGYNPFSPTAVMEETGPISLPPPPRRLMRKKKPPPPPAPLQSPPTSPVIKVPTPKSSTPEMANTAAGPTGQEDASRNNQEASLKKLASINSLYSGAMTGSSSSLLTVNQGSIRSEPSFEELVVHKKTFSTDRPRIISTISIPPSLLSIPSVPTPITERSECSESSAQVSDHQRLPIDDRDSPPATPIQAESDRSEVLPANDVDGIWRSVGGSPYIPDAVQESPNLSSLGPKYATLPLRIEKAGHTKPNPFYMPSDSAGQAYDEPHVVKGPSLIRKGSRTKGPSNMTAETTTTVKSGRNRGKLSKGSRDIKIDNKGFRFPEMPYGILVSAYGQATVPADNPWRHRPLLSHAKSLSRSSAGSLDSATTYNPPSSIDLGPDHRISISSSIYPSSSANNDDADYIQIHDHNDNDDYDYDNPTDDCHDPNDILQEIQNEQVIDSDNYQLMSILSGSRVAHNIAQASAPKPPVPSTPKPKYSRRALSPRSSPSQSPVAPSLVFEGYDLSNGELPPTTNWLQQDERADLIRKSRKLARVFGCTPGPEVMAYQDCSPRISQLSSNRSTSRNLHQRYPLSFTNDLDSSAALRPRRASAWPSPTESHFSISPGRRHSAPMSPDDISFLNASSPLYEASLFQVASQFRSESVASHFEEPADPPVATTISAPVPALAPVAQVPDALSPRTSFIDLYLSDEEMLDDGSISESSKTETHRAPSPSQSLSENMNPEQLAEEERKRKRDKLAKLHRYLGSRVPASLVLGTSDPETNLPPPAQGSSRAPKSSSSETEESTAKKAWLRRRQSSSAALPSTWPDEIERSKEELDNKEKAINVRRAQKMEKVFGVAPPQTLYHTRHSPSPSLPNATIAFATAPKTLGNPSAFIPSSEAVYFTKNPNRSSYQKPKNKKNNRPSTADSSKALLPKGRRSSSGFDETSPVAETFNAFAPSGSYNNGRGSEIYNHYQHSFNSLNDILDRDDRESLLELHNYLNGDAVAQGSGALEDVSNNSVRSRKASDASTLTDRRRSLPARASNSSLNTVASEAPGTSPKPDITDFQLRRRRAAKLTQFFGVHYRELINDVLESLETGLDHEQKRGTLQAEEIEDLVKKLRELKVKREGMF
ncbi:hypothetical protein FA15DRAFT_667211 [Coprinopsis marcescibilis]|uniref:Uncharacterized protein n=1 Tax=Coprinopsis marcescibilis TaxID=230819 RepID=A0A5C3L294_COPMA|nr:hypothetical protein FA15DRAFT_667211 [Coprinopsis marcescibilis]